MKKMCFFFLCLPFIVFAQDVGPNPDVLEDPVFRAKHGLKEIAWVRLEENENLVGGYGSETDGGIFFDKKEYDTRGNKVKDYAFLAEGPLINHTQNHYNNKGLLTHKEHSYGETPYSIEYFFYGPGNRLDSTCHTDATPLLAIRERSLCCYFQYDHLGRLERKTTVLQKDMEMSKANDTIRSEYYEWNDSGQLMTFSSINEKKEVTDIFQYFYNPSGQLILTEHTDGKYQYSDLLSYTYNESGQLSTKTIRTFEKGNRKRSEALLSLIRLMAFLKSKS